MKKKFTTITLTTTLSLAITATVYGGTWEQTGNDWKYKTDNGSYAVSEWQWVDGNKDGIAECYYFDGNGLMLANTTTPDGYTVNADGAWFVDDTVQTKRLDPHLSEVINPQQGLNGGEVMDGKSVAQITLNQEMISMLPLDRSIYKLGAANQILDNIPTNGIEIMAFYTNTGFKNADANRWVVGPTGWDVFGLGDAYMGSRFTSCRFGIHTLTIVLTQGTDGNWYIYPNSQALMN